MKNIYIALMTVVWIAHDLDADTAGQLIKSEERPTMEQVEQLPWIDDVPQSFLRGLHPEKSKSGVNVIPGLDRNLASIEKYIPRAIAQLEAVYPGATFFVLGRDAALIGDILDGFYRSLGQTDRVKRIGFGSGVLDYEEKHWLGILRHSGVDFRADHPQILLDVTSYGPKSQMRTLLKAGRTGFKRAGHSQNIGPLWNGVNLTADSGYILSRPYASLYFDYFKKDAFPWEDIFSVDLNRLGHSLVWHGSYDGVVELKRGYVTSVIHPMADGENGGLALPLARRRILYEMWRARQLVSGKKFFGQVQSWSRRLGFEFVTDGRDQTRPVLSREIPAYQEEVMTMARYAKGDPQRLMWFLEALLGEPSMTPAQMKVNLATLFKFTDDLSREDLSILVETLFDRAYDTELSAMLIEEAQVNTRLAESIIDLQTLVDVSHLPRGVRIRRYLDERHVAQEWREFGRKWQGYLDDVRRCSDVFKLKP